MSKIKSLILGSAAGFVAIAGAQAADLPVKAKAVQYVKICSLYGAGFYYIPGTETCIKLGGYIQADVNIAGGNYGQPSWNAGSGDEVVGRLGDTFTTRARANFNLDTRTATEYGVVRTYWSSNFEHSSGHQASSGNLTVDYGFVQFAGFTFGKAVSTFQTPWGAYGANNNTSYLLGGYDSATGITQIAYTWQFGNGVSAQIGVEDNRVIQRGNLINAAYALTDTQLLTGTYTSSYSGNIMPDFVANVKVDQAAFTFQLSGAIHNVSANYYGTSATGLIETAGHPSDEIGYAVSAGLQLKNLPTGPGDKLSLDATYAKGAVGYIISGVTNTATTGAKNFVHFDDSSFAYKGVATLVAADAVYTTNGDLELTDAWAFRGAYVHNWSPTWESSLFGSYTKVDYNGTASTLLCNQPLTGTSTRAGTCNPDFAIWQIGTRTAWTPVQNLTFSGEVMYTALDQSNGGTVTTATAVSPKPAGVYEYKDQGIWSGNLRVRRTF